MELWNPVSLRGFNARSTLDTYLGHNYRDLFDRLSRSYRSRSTYIKEAEFGTHIVSYYSASRICTDIKAGASSRIQDSKIPESR
jgi:hypothetical protein